MILPKKWFDSSRSPNARKLFVGVRTRMLAVAVIPSLVLVVGAAGSISRSTAQAQQTRVWADVVRQSTPRAADFIGALFKERQLTMLRVAHRPVDVGGLVSERRRVDVAFGLLAPSVHGFDKFSAGAFGALGAEAGKAFQELAVLRARVDAGGGTLDEVYRTFEPLTSAGATAVEILSRHAPDVTAAVTFMITANLYRAADDISAARAFEAAAATESGFDGESLRLFAGSVGAYHNELEVVARSQEPTIRDEIAGLLAGPAWQRLGQREQSLIARGALDADLPVTARKERQQTLEPDQTGSDSSSVEVVGKVMAVWQAANEASRQRAGDIASEARSAAIRTSIALFSVAALVSLLSFWLATRISSRLRRLRAQTLVMAEETLSEVMTRIRAGERVDVESALPGLKFGRDEIGQVAAAFETAQRAAVSAALNEAKTREAVNAVFLNLAHRSHLMAHRQLEVLDAAEAREEDPVSMKLLFQLDHLATRERRNAENLIILGGERPGRQWRNPVLLRDVVRGAVAETQDYSRVHSARFSEVRVRGAVVGDVTHLLAELVDNATFFSPPDASVEVSGNLVGKGAIVEIVDKGIGLASGDLDRLNAVLASAPNFGMMQLSSDSRLGMIVVSVLAAQNKIKVRLTESDYGGVKAVVLIPSELLVAEDSEAGAGPLSPVRATGDLVGGERFRMSLVAAASALDEPRTFTPATVGRPTRQETVLEELGERPLLPRRQKLEGPAAEPPEIPRPVAGSRARSLSARSPEQARDRMSDIADGTKQGRGIGPDTPERMI
ncbi:nitrate- and nitrite sensing domain-containing protein [Nocardia sp. NPDC005366]|uniref:sensor histidine kinase n=1 Tax=Nocardia sp. NPDC005366 TaxID=3156878 RepID=UPI0033AA1B6F